MVKKNLIMVMVSLMLVMAIVSVVDAAEDDDMVVTARGEYLYVVFDNATYDFGTCNAGTSTWTNETGKTQLVITNQTTVTFDFEMKITTDAETWTVSLDIPPVAGADMYVLNASSDSWATQVAINTTAYYDVESNVAAETNVTFDFRFDAPTSSSTGVQQSITVNGKVTIA